MTDKNPLDEYKGLDPETIKQMKQRQIDDIKNLLKFYEGIPNSNDHLDTYLAELKNKLKQLENES